MKMPDTFVQILMVGGYVHDISVDNWNLLKDEICLDKRQLLQVEDVYEGNIYLNPRHITSTRECSIKSAENYRLSQTEDGMRDCDKSGDDNGFQES